MVVGPGEFATDVRPVPVFLNLDDQSDEQPIAIMNLP